ncbi:MAG: TonB-dependent receptor, partial [Candidatus Omnitrophica bacterium]|nr:TonB-dependent receptor [Candidatus Omnitrophota bacterium]
ELERIVVTPARMTQEGYRTASNVTVIDAERIESSSARYVPDILKEELGISVYSSSTDKTTKVDIRGFADTSVNNVLVLINGRKVNSIDISGPDWIQIPLESVERIEVIRGAASVLYGDNAVGGVVNIITKKGQGPMSGRTSAKYGSYNMHQEDIEISGDNNKLSYYLYSRYYNTSGYRSNSDMLTKDYNSRIGYEVSENLSLDLTSGWHEDDYGMPGALNDQGELTQFGRRGSANENDFASTKDRHVKLSLDARPWFDVTEATSFNIDIFYRNRDAYSLFDYDVWGSRATKYKIDTQGVNAKYTYDGNIADRGFSFVVGIDYYDVEHTIDGSGAGVMISTDDIIIYKDELGFYGYSDYELLRGLFVNTGARYQKAKYRFDQKAATVTYETTHPSESVFMGGIRYEYASGSNLHLNAQESFRFLATDEWYSTDSGLNTNLRQQTGVQYEFGVKHKFSDALLVSATPYFIKLKDEIYFDPYVVAFGRNDNYGKTERKGIDLTLTADLMELLEFLDDPLLDKLGLKINYAYLEPKFIGGDYAGNDIPMVPRHLFNTAIDAGFLKKYNISLLFKYVGDRYAINDTRHETAKVKDYFIVDSKLAYKKDNLEIFAGINNVFNEKYYTYVVKSDSSTLRDFYPAPGRNFEIGASYRF